MKVFLQVALWFGSGTAIPAEAHLIVSPWDFTTPAHYNENGVISE